MSATIVLLATVLSLLIILHIDVLEGDRLDLQLEQGIELGRNLSHLPLYTQSISHQLIISVLSS